MNLDDLYEKYTGHLYVRRSDVRELVNFGLEEAAKVADEYALSNTDEVCYVVASGIRNLKTKE